MTLRRLVCVTLAGIVATAAALLLPAAAAAQIRTGSIVGVVEDPGGAPIARCRVQVIDRVTGQARLAETDGDGRFVVEPLPYGTYEVSVSAPAGLADDRTVVVVRSNLPTGTRVRLAMTRFDAAAAVVADPPGPLPISTRSEVQLNDRMGILPVNRATALSAIVSTGPGIARGHNALVHVRGVEDGMLYVIDGVPVTERYDLLHASAIDVDAIDSLSLLTGNLPAEFGGRNGAVVTIDRAPDRRGFGYARAGGGSLGTADAAAGGGAVAGPVHWSVSGAGSASNRTIDPVDERNLHNGGGRYLGAVHAYWRAGDAHRVAFGAGAAGASFEVPNDAEQERAGQDQRQRLDDESLTLGWQHVVSSRTVVDTALFHRRYASRLSPSPFDMPLTASSERSHTRTGAVASVTHQQGRHLFKAGLDVSRTAPEERFTFAITDVEEAEDRDVSEPVLAFGVDTPFVFAASRAGSYAAAYIQDDVALGPLRVDGGLRLERASLPEAAWQLSPRLGAALALAGGDTVVRASINRLFMPPHVEHLLLASSEQARVLSPFADGTHPGGADVRPERVTAMEAGVSRAVGRLMTVDAAYWDRRFTDVADPNVFFNTTIVFPNSVAEGRARGVDLRLTMREHAGFSGFVNYTRSNVDNIGPITGGLFLTDEFLEIGPGTVFHPDHDQPHVLSAGARFHPAARRWWLALDLRHGGGGPLEVEDEDLEEVVAGPGGDLIDVERERMRPWTVLDFAASLDLWSGARGQVSLRADVPNVLGNRFAYTVGNPFEGTRFGHPRMLRIGLEWRSADAAPGRR